MIAEKHYKKEIPFKKGIYMGLENCLISILSFLTDHLFIGYKMYRHSKDDYLRVHLLKSKAYASKAKFHFLFSNGCKY